MFTTNMHCSIDEIDKSLQEMSISEDLTARTALQPSRLDAVGKFLRIHSSLKNDCHHDGGK